MGETAGLGATLVGFCVGGDKVEYQGWIFIKNDDEKNCTLVAKERKWKGKKSCPKSEANGKKLDLSKVKCFHCH